MPSPITTVCLAGAFASLTSLLFGFDTGSIGAITSMPQFTEQFGLLDPLLRGFVVAVILIPSALSGLIGGSISDRISRKRTLALGSLVFACGSSLSAGSRTLGMLIAGRCIAGIGEGFFLSVLSVYICEISPIHVRGRIMTFVQLTTTGGIATGFFVCYGTVKIPSSLSWRLPFIIQTISALGLAVGCLFLPYSPRWLVSRGRRGEAELVLDRLVGTEDTIERKELLAVPSTGDPSFLAIFRKDVRRRTFLGAFLNVAMQATGIDFVLYFAPLLFAEAGLDPTTASFYASGITGVVLLLTTLAGTAYIDRVGRRQLFLVGGLCICFSELMIGVLLASNAQNTPIGRVFVIGFVEIFAIAFSGSWALCVRLYGAEIQPTSTRASASSFGQGLNQASNFVVAVTGPLFIATSSYAPFITYASFTAFATAVAYFYMPETVGKSLESIDSTFSAADSALAVSWPSFSLRRTEVRRRSSRAGSTALAGESRAEFREALKLGSIQSTVLSE